MAKEFIWLALYVGGFKEISFSESTDINEICVCFLITPPLWDIQPIYKYATVTIVLHPFITVKNLCLVMTGNTRTLKAL